MQCREGIFIMLFRLRFGLQLLIEICDCLIVRSEVGAIGCIIRVLLRPIVIEL